MAQQSITQEEQKTPIDAKQNEETQVKTDADNTEISAPAPKESDSTESNNLPKTQAEFEAAIRAAKLEGARETANNAAKQIKKLEEKVATKVGINGFPKIVVEGKTLELQFCSRMVIKNEDGENQSISYEAMVNDDVAKNELNMTAKEVIAMLYEMHPKAFTEAK
ncbi:hypothetical protein VB796_06525 [Arcicella sp. LKC2W]|uniref:hypothetical protein n=1 Tax=Arcicella sp. LKC2W TaxID=2984198 RepID=UPI002B200C19|nr:hypothetical protein [Arcicella sp. LKC2W]MEA5458682.1 hypothetical protein [Arcicella sp. LKC2W]